MRFWFAVLLAAAVFHTTVAAQVDACVPAQGEPLRIGVVFPPDTLFGTDAADPYRGVQAMVTAVNGCGGVAGRPVELVFAPAGNYETARSAVGALRGQAAVIVGSGSAVVSDVLVQAAGEDSFFYWEISEPLDSPHAYALSPRPNNQQIGAQAAAFVQSSVRALLPNAQTLRVALVYEDNQRGRALAAGITQALDEPPVIEYLLTEGRADGYRIAVQMREQRVNVVMVAAFGPDADALWSDMRRADANVTAWVQVGGDQYRHDLCARLGNADGVMAISAAGAVSADYRQTATGPVYDAYVAAYEALFQRLPEARADLAASGMYVLLREILPRADGSYTPAAIQRAAANTVSTGTALMGEGWSVSAQTWANQQAVTLAAQQQNGTFCTVAPALLATCGLEFQPMPTWRDRARAPAC